MLKKLRIAQVANIIERVPPKRYGGTERIVYALTEELVKRGHKVSLFASGDSQTSAKLFAIYPKSLREARLENIYGANALSLLNIGYAYSRADQFDIIHDHNCYLSLPTANLSKTPVVMTLHGPLGINKKRIFENLNKPYLVSVSKAQAYQATNINYVGNVYNGLNMNLFPFSKKDNGYLLFVGRISREKGVHFAIEAAQYLNLPLIIAAKLDSMKDSSDDVQYFHESIEPKLSDQIRWVGEVDEQERNRLMSKALCFLHPVTWNEPFGLTMIEAMACGCPVIAFNMGSIPEIVVDGKTGFIVNNVIEMIEAVSNIKKIKREECRKYVLRNFNAKKMADEYEKIYYKILEKGYLEKGT